jgi:putative ABC transport system permease protein
MVGLGEPRVVRAGVVGGPTSGDGPAPVASAGSSTPPTMGRRRRRGGADAPVLEHGAQSDPNVLGTDHPAGRSRATIIGVLQPSVPYPAETEIIANVVTSPHHLDATMVDGRVHRMTELFGRLAPGAELETARAELRAVHAAMVAEHPEAYPAMRASGSTRSGCATRSRRRRARCCWCCWRRRRWCSSSPARTSPT